MERASSLGRLSLVLDEVSTASHVKEAATYLGPKLHRLAYQLPFREMDILEEAELERRFDKFARGSA